MQLIILDLTIPIKSTNNVSRATWMMSLIDNNTICTKGLTCLNEEIYKYWWIDFSQNRRIKLSIYDSKLMHFAWVHKVSRTNYYNCNLLPFLCIRKIYTNISRKKKKNNKWGLIHTLSTTFDRLLIDLLFSGKRDNKKEEKSSRWWGILLNPRVIFYLIDGILCYRQNR